MHQKKLIWALNMVLFDALVLMLLVKFVNLFNYDAKYLPNMIICFLKSTKKVYFLHQCRNLLQMWHENSRMFSQTGLGGFGFESVSYQQQSQRGYQSYSSALLIIQLAHGKYLPAQLIWLLSSSTPGSRGGGLGSSFGHTKDFKNGTYCSSVCAGHNQLD